MANWNDSFDVRGFRVLVPASAGVHPFTPLNPGDLKFKLTACIAELALDLLGCKASIPALKTITRGVIEANPLVQGLRGLSNQPQAIDAKIRDYLRTTRNSFPHVLISDKFGMATKNGRTNKRDCGGNFEPKTAAVIEINASLMDRLANAHKSLSANDSDANRERFHTLTFRLGITMAHELVHVYVLYLLRSGSDHTPPPITYGPFGDEEVGESGRNWEFNFLGGFVDMRKVPGAGENEGEVVALRDDQNIYCWRIKARFISGLITHRNFNDARWLEPYTPLHDREHPQFPATDPVDPVVWKAKYTDLFAESSNNREELGATNIAFLIGPNIMQSPQYDMFGDDLQRFLRRPDTSLGHMVR